LANLGESDDKLLIAGRLRRGLLRRLLGGLRRWLLLRGGWGWRHSGGWLRGARRKTQN
jgi:hypothetical protein